MRALRVGSLLLAAAAAGCMSDSAALTLDGEGGGERAAEVACDGEGGLASLVLALVAQARSGVATYLVLDGAGALVLERHVAVGSGAIDEERTVTGAPGTWTLEERRTGDFDGELDATLTCG